MGQRSGLRLLRRVGVLHPVEGPRGLLPVQGPPQAVHRHGGHHVRALAYPVEQVVQAIYRLAASKKGISAHQLHRMLGITYKSAWFMCHRLREAMKPARSRRSAARARWSRRTRHTTASCPEKAPYPQEHERPSSAPVTSARSSLGRARRQGPLVLCRTATVADVAKIVREHAAQGQPPAYG